MFHLMSLRRLIRVFVSMRTRILLFLLTLTLATVVLGSRNLIAAAAQANGKEPALNSATNAPASAPTAGKTEDKCLDCHGPFNKLVAATTNYVASSGEKISPHRYVPHDSKLEKDIPDCSHCHKAHSLSSLPAKGSIDLSKVSVEWCFECHHEKTFQSCKDCHP